MPETLIEKFGAYCWSNSFLSVFRKYFEDHGSAFVDAPDDFTSGEHDLHYFELFQDYLTIYESTLTAYLKTIDCTAEQLYQELRKTQAESTDSHTILTINSLVESANYAAFYKVMSREGKKYRESGEASARVKKEADDKALKQRKAEEAARAKKEADDDRARKQNEDEEAARIKKEAEDRARKQKEVEEAARVDKEADDKARKQKEDEAAILRVKEAESALVQSATSNFSGLNAKQIADLLVTFGEQYVDYRDNIIKMDLSGAVVAQSIDENDLSDILKEVGVTSKLQQRAIEIKFRSFYQPLVSSTLGTATITSSGSAPSAA